MRAKQFEEAVLYRVTPVVGLEGSSRLPAFEHLPLWDSPLSQHTDIFSS